MKLYLFDSEEFSSMSLAELIDLSEEFGLDSEEFRVEDEEEWRKSLAAAVEENFHLIYGGDDDYDAGLLDFPEVDEW